MALELLSQLYTFERSIECSKKKISFDSDFLQNSLMVYWGVGFVMYSRIMSFTVSKTERGICFIFKGLAFPTRAHHIAFCNTLLLQSEYWMNSRFPI